MSSVDKLKYRFGVHFPSLGVGGQSRPSFSSTAISLNHQNSNAPLLIAAVEGLRGSIRGQIAVKLSLDTIVRTALSMVPPTPGTKYQGPKGQEIAQAAFKEANQAVYDYSHSMRSGGQIGASGFVAVFDGDKLCMAKVGLSEGYLYRAGKLLPLHQTPPEEVGRGGALQRFIGANAQVLVDFASVAVKDKDLIIILTNVPPKERLESVTKALERSLKEVSPLEELSRNLSDCVYSEKLTGSAFADRNFGVFALQVGQPTIKLREVLEEGDEQVVSESSTLRNPS